MALETTNQLIFLENEYDVLERNLMLLDSETDAFRKVADFIKNKFFSKFVVFASVQKDGSVSRLFSTDENANLDFELSERAKADSSLPALMIHLTGSFSAPFKLPGEISGLIFVGPRTDGIMYNMEKLREMVPIVRTFNKSLVFIEATKNRLEKEKLKYAFSKYISPEVVNNIIESEENVHPGGVKTNLSIIFTDLQNFTVMSEKMTPEKIVRVLNEYLNEMSQVIISLGGTIDKFEGDAIMAFFGAPKNFTDHALRCCLSALRMKRMEEILNSRLISCGLIETPLFTRIGVNTGEVIVGNIGSTQRLDYTIIGSNVNIASRIENVNKHYGTKILISENTYNVIKDYFETKYVDEAELKGVQEKVKVYELIAEKVEMIPNYKNYVHAVVEPDMEEELEEI